MQISVPVSLGEILDKISILEIKHERIADPGKRANVAVELKALREAFAAIALTDAQRRALEAPMAALKAINTRLWEIEDEIRICERKQQFDDAFVALARAVYQNNDERARIKKEVNVSFGSRLVEEKSFA